MLFLDDIALDNLPVPKWLVDGVISENSLVVLYGKPGCGKSFVALDLALAIATSRSWQGRQITRGSVLYVAAEGLTGLVARVRGWKREHDVERVRRARFHSGALHMLNYSEVNAFIQEAKELSPVLVIIDTLARCMVGGDEDSAQDTGTFIEYADRIRTALKATVLILHHPAKRIRTERGSSALRGAVDTMIEQSSSGRMLTLKCEKQKDAAPFDSICFKLKPVAIGDSMTTCVVVPTDGESAADGISPSEANVLDALKCAGGRMSSQRLARASGLKERTFYRTLKELIQHNSIKKTNRDQRVWYEIVEPEAVAATATGLPRR